MCCPLYKIFGGFKTKINNNATHLSKLEQPTIYIISHKFSYMDIVVSAEVFSQLNNRIGRRTIVGIADVPEWFSRFLPKLYNFWYPRLFLIAYNKRFGNTTKEMVKHLCLGDDVIIWQQPYNKSRGLYYILEQCIYLHHVNPRVVYIDIDDKLTTETLNNESILQIIKKTHNKTYHISSYEIEYDIQQNASSIYDDFTSPFWKSIETKLKR